MGGGQPGSEEIVRRETIYAGKLLTLRRDQVRLESGREATREVVLHPGAVAVVPLLPNGRVVMVRQYRHAAGRALLEIPAGTLDQQGESAEDAVARELQGRPATARPTSRPWSPSTPRPASAPSGSASSSPPASHAASRR